MNRRTEMVKIRRRPNKSASFPYMGTVVVEASRYALKTQLYLDTPPSSETTVGMAVPTAVASRAARNMARAKEAVTSLLGRPGSTFLRRKKFANWLAAAPGALSEGMILMGWEVGGKDGCDLPVLPQFPITRHS